MFPKLSRPYNLVPDVSVGLGGSGTGFSVSHRNIPKINESYVGYFSDSICTGSRSRGNHGIH